MQPLDLGAHVDAQLGVEIGERLVEEEDLGIAHQGAAHGDALALAARELGGPPVQQMADLQHLGDPRDRRIALRLGHAAHLHAEGDIPGDRHVGIERVGLEHHGDVALGGMQLVDPPPGDADLPAGHRLEPGDGVEQGRLAAARGADEDEEAALLDLEVDPFQHLGRAVALGQPLDFQKCHLHPLTAPAMSPRTK